MVGGASHGAMVGGASHGAMVGGARREFTMNSENVGSEMQFDNFLLQKTKFDAAMENSSNNFSK